MRIIKKIIWSLFLDRQQFKHISSGKVLPIYTDYNL